MVKCKICGCEKEFSIKDHLKWTHGLNKKSYQELYPNAEITSKNKREQISKNMKEVWSNEGYKEKMSKIRQVTHNKPEFKEKMSKITTERYKENPELLERFHNWHKTDEFMRWVVSDERIKKIRESTKKRWDNDEYRKRVCESISKTLSDGRCQKSEEFKDKMSKIITEKYINGELTNNCSKYENGWYLSKDGCEYYFASSLEKESMVLLDRDEHVVGWTNKHGIIIPYVIDGRVRRYVPDFLINMRSGDKLLVEMKGWETEKVVIKGMAAKEKYKNYKICYNINELKNYLDEFKYNKEN